MASRQSAPDSGELARRRVYGSISSIHGYLPGNTLPRLLSKFFPGPVGNLFCHIYLVLIFYQLKKETELHVKSTKVQVYERKNWQRRTSAFAKILMPLPYAKKRKVF